MLVSIVIPTKNRLGLLKEALASVKDQTFSNWETLVVDDGSSDGTLEWVEAAGKHDPRGAIAIVRRLAIGFRCARIQSHLDGGGYLSIDQKVRQCHKAEIRCHSGMI